MRLIVLGAAAGGGFPQWNSACPVGRRAWQRDPAARWRTQCSVALSADGERWTLLNASPDLRQQILATPALHPRRGPAPQPDRRGRADQWRRRSRRRSAELCARASPSRCTPRARSWLCWRAIRSSTCSIPSSSGAPRLTLEQPVELEGGVDGRAVRRAGQGAALSGGRRAGHRRRDRGRDRARAARRRPGRARSSSRAARASRRRSPSVCAARRWSCSTAPCGPTTR